MLFRVSSLDFKQGSLYVLYTPQLPSLIALLSGSIEFDAFDYEAQLTIFGVCVNCVGCLGSRKAVVRGRRPFGSLEISRMLRDRWEIARPRFAKSESEWQEVGGRVMSWLGLAELRNMKISDLAEEERVFVWKKVLIGLEVLGDPVYFVVEDLFDGVNRCHYLELIGYLNDIAESGRTVVANFDTFFSIPNPNITTLIFIIEGNKIFSGNPDELSFICQSIGNPAPEHVPPFEHFCKIVSFEHFRYDNREMSYEEALSSWRESMLGIRSFFTHWETPEEPQEILKENFEELIKGVHLGILPKSLNLVRVLIRYFKMIIKETKIIIFRILSLVLFTLVAYAFDNELDSNHLDTFGAIRNKVSVLFLLVIGISLSSLLAKIYSMLEFRIELDREGEKNLFSRSLFSFFSSVVDIVIETIVSIVISAIISSGFYNISFSISNTKRLLNIGVGVFLLIWASSGLGQAISEVSKNKRIMYALLVPVLLMMLVFNDFYLKLDDDTFFVVYILTFMNPIRLSFSIFFYEMFDPDKVEILTKTCRLRKFNCNKDTISCYLPVPNHAYCNPIVHYSETKEEIIWMYLFGLMLQGLIFRLISSIILYQDRENVVFTQEGDYFDEKLNFGNLLKLNVIPVSRILNFGQSQVKESDVNLETENRGINLDQSRMDIQVLK